MSPHPSDHLSERSYVSTKALHTAMRTVKSELAQLLSEWQGQLLSCPGQLKIISFCLEIGPGRDKIPTFVADPYQKVKFLCVCSPPSKTRFLAPKYNFCHTIPNVVNAPFVALRETIHIQPLEGFFDFSFLSYSHFRDQYLIFYCPREIQASK